MNGESVQGELPIHSNAEQPRTGQTDQRFKITERKWQIHRRAGGRVPYQNCSRTDVARPDEWIEDQSQKEIWMVERRNTNDRFTKYRWLIACRGLLRPLPLLQRQREETENRFFCRGAVQTVSTQLIFIQQLYGQYCSCPDQINVFLIGSI